MENHWKNHSYHGGMWFFNGVFKFNILCNHNIFGYMNFVGNNDKVNCKHYKMYLSARNDVGSYTNHALAKFQRV